MGSHKTQSNKLVLFREILGFCCESRTKYIRAVREQNSAFRMSVLVVRVHIQCLQELKMSLKDSNIYVYTQI